jgi:Tfp pilus assembly protein PilO
MNRQAMITVGSLAGGLLLVVWLCWQFLLNPVSKDISAKNVELTAKKEELSKVKDAQAKYDKFKRDAEATRHEVQLLRQRLDPVLPTGEMVRIINGQAQSLNARDMSWSYSPRIVSKLEGQSNLDEIPFKMKFKCDYETVGRLLNGMVSQMRLISPEKVTLATFDDKAEGRVTLEATIEFKLFLETAKGGS